jgi:glutathione S-transferase
VVQLPHLMERGRTGLCRLFEMFDRQLAQDEFVTAEQITVADITALYAVGIAKGLGNSFLPEEYAHPTRWYNMIKVRSSAK